MTDEVTAEGKEEITMVRVKSETMKALEPLKERTGKSKQFMVNEALKNYIAINTKG